MVVGSHFKLMILWKSVDVCVSQLVIIGHSLGHKCSREAVLTPQSTQPIRLSTVIIATESGTYTCIDMYMYTTVHVHVT